MAGGNPKDETVVPEWAIDLYKSYGSPDLSTHDDVYVGPLIGRKSGLRKDDIVEMVIDARAVREEQQNVIRGMLISTGRSSIDLLDEDGSFRSFSRDVIVEIRLIAHMRPQYIDDDELLFFEREDMRRRTSVSEQAERKADGHDDSHVWG
ncbi:MAG: hypothetical protein EB156_02190 [Euryarchaeota archaeon]|nr:hypothetical protein [Euryarchaeota archaeon]NDB93175.1 hypothetical protein [Euryarchaeota archaeon]NDF21973.1 hypothetical protein [Euryarchaeota archaeon]NDF36586.1 hypothetical protein [Euryarchaeota archaeon]NDG21450.1 hypothetical protein [Euryarchaeota archaeon]